MFIFFFYKTLRIDIQDFFVTLSGPSCSFRDHINARLPLVLGPHKISQSTCITSKVYHDMHDTYKLHTNFFEVCKNDDLSLKLSNFFFCILFTL